jgi:hypothetical protein
MPRRTASRTPRRMPRRTPRRTTSSAVVDVEVPTPNRKPPARLPARNKFTGDADPTFGEYSIPVAVDGRCGGRYRPCGLWYGIGASWFNYAQAAMPATVDLYRRLYAIRLRATVELGGRQAGQTGGDGVPIRQTDVTRRRRPVLVVRGVAGARRFVAEFVRPDYARAGRVLEADVLRGYAARSLYRPDGGLFISSESNSVSTLPFYDWSRLVRRYAGVEFRGMLAAVRTLAREAGMDPAAAAATWRGDAGPSSHARPGFRGTPPDELLWLFALNADSGVLWAPMEALAAPPHLVARRGSAVDGWRRQSRRQTE